MTDLFKRGLAVGRSDIRTDSMHFRFYDEVFEIRARNLRTRRFRGHLVAKIADVRKAANG